MENTKIVEILKEIIFMLKSKTEKDFRKNFITELDEAIKLPFIFEALDGIAIGMAFDKFEKEITKKHGEDWFVKVQPTFEVFSNLLNKIIEAIENAK